MRVGLKARLPAATPSYCPAQLHRGEKKLMDRMIDAKAVKVRRGGVQDVYVQYVTKLYNQNQQLIARPYAQYRLLTV